MIHFVSDVANKYMFLDLKFFSNNLSIFAIKFPFLLKIDFVCDEKAEILLKPVTRMSGKGCNVFVGTIDFLLLEHYHSSSDVYTVVHTIILHEMKMILP